MEVNKENKAEILCIGSELLLGNIVNSNSKWLAEELAALGLPHFRQTVIGDNSKKIQSIIKEASKRCNLLITTGGLGPTPDDLTTKAIASTFKSRLVRFEEVLLDLENKSNVKKSLIPKSYFKQALFPKEAILIPNKNGTAPGMIWTPVKGFTVITLPGVPLEMKSMWSDDVKKWIKRNVPSDGVIVSKVLKFTGINESNLSEKINDYINNQNPTVAPYASLGEVKIRITSKAKNIDSAKELIEPIEKEIIQRSSSNFFGYDEDTLAEKVINLLKHSKQTISVAESCTGGKLGSSLTSISGVSSVFLGGVIAYSNLTKQNVLGVKEQLIEDHGAVSSQVVEAMAKGVKKRLYSDWGLAISGIAGPTGGTNQKPIGFVQIGIAGKELTKSIQINFGTHRTRFEIQELSVIRALDELRIILMNQT